MDKQQLILKIQNLTDRKSLLDLINEIKADMLGNSVHRISMHTMMLLCNPRYDGTKGKQRYRMFTIPKKSGGFREIHAPNGNLTWLQLCLNEIFKAVYVPSSHAMGFTKGRSIVDNARMHTNQNYVFNIDLDNFFPSIDQARIWKRLQLAPFNFNKEVANIIAGLCSIKSLRATSTEELAECYILPQGAPTSPILSNAICDTLDRRLAGLAKRFGLHYSRYADDITFSSMHNVYQADSAFRKELLRIISDQHFTINPKKTRLQHIGDRQEVTGLTVGKKINVTRKYVKDVRAILHIWERYGLNAAIAAFYPRYKSEKGYIHNGEPNVENVIYGKLCFLKMVKGEKDPVYSKLAEKFSALTAKGKISPVCERSWEYLATETIPEFEKRLNVKLQFATSKNGREYGFFELNGYKIMVSISQNLSIKKMPADIQISLCVQTDFKLRFQPDISLDAISVFKDSPSGIIERVDKDCPLPDDLGRRYFYLVHRRLKEGASRRIVIRDKKLAEFKQFIVKIADEHPKLGLCDDLGIIESPTKKDVLTCLVESGFDLSIL